MKKFLRDYFSFNQVELKGIRILLVFLFLLVVFYLVSPSIFQQKRNENYASFRAEVDTFLAHSYVDTTEQRFQKKNWNSYSQKFPNKNQAFELQPFDPNGLPLEVWVQMGLSEKQAMVIKNYEAKGGRFRNKEDVKRQYVISNTFYQRIEPYLVFASLNDEIYEEHKTLSVDINHATESDWELLNGIGTTLAGRIIKYRDKLGGFYSVEQLKEVYGLKPETYQLIQPHCIVTPYSLRQININLASNNELFAHPYIGKLAGAIIQYRKQKGPFKNQLEFKNARLVDDTIYVKLVPYLQFTL